MAPITATPRPSDPPPDFPRARLTVATRPRLSDRLAALAPAGPDAELAWNPQFLRQGYALGYTLHPNRLVAGVRSERAEQLL
ncbi:hypothetical protein UK12_34070, partial [Saccharothrix sp. ST-888]